ncbi:MAG: zinc metallopeptidase [Oscillospiraceae bacterium]|nr:zinc metallopeptidase [Oscillospiraceae bacterium]MBP1553235.1 zinc metallopeptidase [Oscillospiraceae bacterium]MBP1571432.1 zinc metallopeptidase [Oscillospiraceae bacterium]MBQ5313664.1 zinc metallopeptidase [Oscillospiraceae bacterium]
MYYGIDTYYLILVIPAMIFSMWAQAKVNSTFKRYSQQRTYSGMTGYEAARRILAANGLYNVQVERVAGNLTDHYDPKTNVIRLSDSVFGSNSVAAVGVAAHEAGHAVQYAQNYAPIKLRSAIIPVTNIGSQLSIPLVLIGAFMGMDPLINIGLLLFATVAVFQLVTLPVEFNASRRAVNALEMSGSIGDEELYGVKKVLGAAAMTYVAALAVAVANLLRLILRFGGRRRD